MSTESRLKRWKRKLEESDENAKDIAKDIGEYLNGSWLEVKERLDSLKNKLERDE